MIHETINHAWTRLQKFSVFELSYSVSTADFFTKCQVIKCGRKERTLWPLNNNNIKLTVYLYKKNVCTFCRAFLRMRAVWVFWVHRESMKGQAAVYSYSIFARLFATICIPSANRGFVISAQNKWVTYLRTCVCFNLLYLCLEVPQKHSHQCITLTFQINSQINVYSETYQGLDVMWQSWLSDYLQYSLYHCCSYQNSKTPFRLVSTWVKSFCLKAWWPPLRGCICAGPDRCNNGFVIKAVSNIIFKIKI